MLIGDVIYPDLMFEHTARVNVAPIPDLFAAALEVTDERAQFGTVLQCLTSLLLASFYGTPVGVCLTPLELPWSRCFEKF